MLNNAVRLLLQTGLYTSDFEDWDCKIAANKLSTNLKTFIQESYTRRLNVTSITTGVQGYVQNTYAALADELEDEDDDIQTVITQMAALTTQSQLMASTVAETNASVTMAIHQLAANQHAMQQQFPAFASTRNTMYQPATPAPPPMQHVRYLLAIYLQLDLPPLALPSEYSPVRYLLAIYLQRNVEFPRRIITSMYFWHMAQYCEIGGKSKFTTTSLRYMCVMLRLGAQVSRELIILCTNLTVRLI